MCIVVASHPHRLTYGNAFSVPLVDFVLLARGSNPGRRLHGEMFIDRPRTDPTIVTTPPVHFVKDHHEASWIEPGGFIPGWIPSADWRIGFVLVKLS